MNGVADISRVNMSLDCFLTSEFHLSYVTYLMIILRVQWMKTNKQSRHDENLSLLPSKSLHMQNWHFVFKGCQFRKVKYVLTCIIYDESE